MDAFNFVFSLFGLLLGLTLAEVLSGFGRALRHRRIVHLGCLSRLAMRRRLSCIQTGTSYNPVTAWCARDDGVDLSCEMARMGMAAPWERFDREGRLRACRR